MEEPCEILVPFGELDGGIRIAFDIIEVPLETVISEKPPGGLLCAVDQSHSTSECSKGAG